MSVKLCWRVYVRTPEFDFYAYSAVGARTEALAIEAVRQLITPGKLPLVARVGTIEDVETYPPLPH